MAHYKGAASEAGRAMQLLKKREQAQMEIEYRKKKIEEELKISNIENKFAAHYDAVEQQLKTSTIGLVTLDEMKAKQENIVKERERKLAQKQAEKEREQQRQLEAKQAERNRQKRQISKSMPGDSCMNYSKIPEYEEKPNKKYKRSHNEVNAEKSNMTLLHEFVPENKNYCFKKQKYFEDGEPFSKQTKIFVNRENAPVTKSSSPLNYEEGNDNNEEEDDGDKEMYPKKRENKNRPTELSSKAPVRSKLPKPTNRIDPRFDSLCGSYNEQFFNQAYSFIGVYKENELKRLKKMHRRTKSPKVRSEIGLLIERLTNQKKAQEKNEALKKNKKEEKEAYIKAMLEGQQTPFPKRQENSVTGLLQDFEELQKAGKLQKYIQKKSKKRSKNSQERGYK